MSILHIRHIEKHLTDLYSDKIDVSDLEGRPAAERHASFMTRALAAFAVQTCASCDTTEAAASVTDGFGDNGIDAVHIDIANSTILLIQAKWSSKGNTTIPLGEMHKYLAGVQDLLFDRHERFSARFQGVSEIMHSVLDNIGCRIQMIVIHTSTNSMGKECLRAAQDVLERFNDTSEVVTFLELNQRYIHEAASRTLDGTPIALDVTLQDWGRIEEPYRAYYGQVSAEDVGQWWARYRDQIFAKNIRRFLPKSSINKMISDTLMESPHEFWYMNNGITLLCEKIEKKVLGGPDRGLGYFSCQGVSVINGAQTVGAIGRLRASGGDYADQVKKARVFARFISLEDCPDGFASRVTVATNTQNRIQARDFAALDPEQERICRELRFEDIEYVYKSGVALPTPKRGFTIEDATIALACAAEDLKLAVMAKASLGALWEMGSPQYRTLFNPSITGPHAWWSVQVYYVVENAMREMRRTPEVRAVAYHGNRFTLRQVFRALRHQGVKSLSHADIRGLTRDLVARIAPLAEATGIYPASVFKNAEHCSKIESLLSLDGIMILSNESDIFDRQLDLAARAHPNYRPQMPLFADDFDVFS